MQHPDHVHHEHIAREREMERQDRACPRICRLNEAMRPVTLKMNFRDPHHRAMDVALDAINHELLYLLGEARDVTAEEEAQVLAGLEYVRQEIA